MIVRPWIEVTPPGPTGTDIASGVADMSQGSSGFGGSGGLGAVHIGFNGPAHGSCATENVEGNAAEPFVGADVPDCRHPASAGSRSHRMAR
jgi:hypothetical protein